MMNWKWMTATCIAVAASIMAATTASPVQDVPGPQQSQPDKLYTGQVAIRITGNLATNLIDEGRIHQILNGGEGFDAVAKKVLGVTLPSGGAPGYSVWVGFDGGTSKGRDGILTAQIKIQIPNTGDTRHAADAIL